MREWWVAGGIIEGAGDTVLLVQNRRRHGGHDWTPPGGVIDLADNETILEGLTREVAEETSLEVLSWAGPLYRVETRAPGLGWRMRVEVYRAVEVRGELSVGGDPDGIVVDAEYLDPAAVGLRLAGGARWVAEPLVAWLAERWEVTREFSYEVDGDGPQGQLTVRRV